MVANALVFNIILWDDDLWELITELHSIEEFFSWLVCVRWPRVLEKHRMIGKLVISLIYLKEEKNAPTTETLLSLASWKSACQVLWKKTPRNK